MGIEATGSNMESVAQVESTAVDRWPAGNGVRSHRVYSSPPGRESSAIQASGWRLSMRAVALVLLVLFGVVSVGFCVAETRGMMLALAPVLVWLVSLLVAVPALLDGGWRFAGWVVGTGVFILVLEAAAVNSDALFGTYSYGPALGIAWRGVPLAVALNWTMMIHGSVSLACWSVPPRMGHLGRTPAIPLLAGMVVLVFSLVAEPAAVDLGFYAWEGRTLPAGRPLAWFVLAVAAAVGHPRRRQAPAHVDSAGRLAAVFVALQMAFFAALRVF